MDVGLSRYNYHDLIYFLDYDGYKKIPNFAVSATNVYALTK